MAGVQAVLQDRGLLRDLALEYEQLKASGGQTDYRTWVRARLAEHNEASASRRAGFLSSAGAPAFSHPAAGDLPSHTRTATPQIIEAEPVFMCR